MSLKMGLLNTEVRCPYYVFLSFSLLDESVKLSALVILSRSEKPTTMRGSKFGNKAHFRVLSYKSVSQTTLYLA